MFDEIGNNKFKKRIIIVVATISVLLLGIKAPNFIYGVFNPPQRVEDIYISVFNDSVSYDEVIIEYWDKSKNVMYFKAIDDIDVVNNIYELTGDIKIKQTFWDDDPVWYSRQLRLIEKGFLRVKFINSEDNKSWMYYIVDNKYYCSSSMMMIEFNTYKQPIDKVHIFDYLNQFADKYDQETVARHIP